MKGQDFGATQRLERAYANSVKRLLSYVLPKKTKEETLQEYLARMAEVSRREDVREVSDYLARKMTAWVNVLNNRGWRAAASKTQRSRHLHALLMREMGQAQGSQVTRLARENSAYIQSLPRRVAEQLGGEMARAQQAGARPATVARALRARFPKLLRSKTEALARDGAQRASLALTQARCEDLNLPFYIWSTSEDGRVRISHRRMNGVVVPWDDPPLIEGHRYHAGGVYGCRCTQIVVLHIDDIRFPAPVWWKGHVRTLTKVQFKGLISA